MTIYEQQGYESRLDYLTNLAANVNETPELVFEAADLLGPEEDFDGLITALKVFGILQ